MRSTEVTVNKMTVVIISICTFCYVLKMHILEKENYITQEEWVNLWQKALQVDYRPVVNIKAIKPNQKAIKILNRQSKRHQNIRLSHLIFN